MLTRTTLALLVSAPLALLATPADAATTPMCAGKTATIVGTSRNDRLVGTAGDDVIVGLKGNDRILGRGGNDTICGGDGADRLDGGPGNDQLYGQRDQRWLDRGGLNLQGDTLHGGLGNDLLHPGIDRRTADNRYGDTLRFNQYARAVHVDVPASKVTGQGRDTIAAVGPVLNVELSSRADTYVGAGGRDIVYGNGGGDTVALGAGDDVFDEMWGGGGNDVVDAGAGDDAITLHRGSDRVSGGDGDDLVVAANRLVWDGGAGDDFVRLQPTAAPGTVLDGGAGRDDLTLDARKGLTGLRMNARTGQAVLARDGGDALFRFSGMESYLLPEMPSSFVGRDTGETLVGPSNYRLRARMFGGNDAVTGGDRVDVLDGGPGRDQVWGLGGRDRCTNFEVVRSC